MPTEKSKTLASFPRAAQDARLKKSLRVLYRNRMATLGTLLLVAWILIALFAPLISPYEPNEQDLYARLKPMFYSEEGKTYVLGSDHLGRDILTRLTYGARVSLLVGVSAAIFSGLIGVMLGGLAGYWGGRFDEGIMGLADLQMAFPSILLALVVGGHTGTRPAERDHCLCHHRLGAIRANAAGRDPIYQGT